MSKLNKIQKILIAFVVIIITLLTKSNAVGETHWFNSYDELKASKDFYCIEHQDGMDGGEWYASETKTYNSDDKSQSNRALAYILREGERTGNGGYNYWSKYQIAVWKWYYNYHNINTNWPSEYTDNGLYEEAMKVKEIPFSNPQKAAVTGNSRKITMTGLTGSISLKNITGKISKIEVKWKDSLDNNKEYTRIIRPGHSGIKDWIGFYSDKDCTQELKIDDISKGNIYLKNFKENYLIKSVKIYTESEGSGYSVKVTRWKKTTGSSSQQDLITAELTEGKETEANATFTANYSYGKIKLVKQGVYNQDGEEKTEKVSATFKIYCTTLNKWVAGEANGYKRYVDNINEATSYQSDTTVYKLFSNYEYEIVEVGVENNYYNDPIKMVAAKSNLQSDLKVSERDSYNTATGVIIYSGKTNKVTIKNGRTSGDIVIHKVDNSFNQINLKDARFKVYLKDTGWLIRNSDGTYSYNGTEETATEFVTDDKGEARINCVKKGTYYVYETKAPEGYNLKAQEGYENKNGKDPYTFSANNKWAYLGDVNLDDNSQVVTFTVSNKKIVELEGYVWVENPEDKSNERDNIYKSDKKDILKSGVTVNLHDKKGAIVATTTTDGNGYYKFTTKNASSYTGEDKNIYYWDLANSYVEFIYNNKTTYNEDGTVKEYGYIAVDPFAGTDAKVNSKAQEYKMTTSRLDDNNLTGTTGNNPGRAVTYLLAQSISSSQLEEKTKNISEKINNNIITAEDLKDAPLACYYNNQTYKVSNINLGLHEQVDSEFKVDENLDYIKVKMKGYTYTYKYGEPAKTESRVVPTVREQNSSKSYTGKIYPTDIVYNIAEASQELEVYVVYKIDVENLQALELDDTYVEQRLYLESLESKYDKNRYTLCYNENNEDNKDFALWTENNTGKIMYNLNDNNSAYINGIGRKEKISSYVQFKVKEDALERILTRTVTEEERKTVAVQAVGTGYHEYLRTDNLWIHEDNIRAFEGCKGTNNYPTSSASGKKYYIHKTISKDYTGSELYLDLSLGDPRTISGTVFEDIRTPESEKDNTNLGNGILEGNETNRGSEVTVELLNADKTTVSKLYQEKDGKVVYENGKLPEAITKTTTGGTFKFEGVVPGAYYVRFTYGDGSQKMMPAEEAIKSNDYKSTIINTEQNGAGNIIKNAMEATLEDMEKAINTLLKDNSNEEAKKLAEWYKHLNGSYSTAVDDINQRLNVEKYQYKDDGKVYDEEGNEVTNYPTNINAYTPMASISIENDIKNENTSKNGENQQSSEYNEFNFGIIKEAPTVVTLNKKITNIEFNTQTGTTLVSANPKDRTASYVTALDDITGGSKYAKLEIDPNLIYGSQLATTYEIEIQNNSAKDYIEEEGSNEFGHYYKYGKSEKVSLKKVKVNEIIDELDKKYSLDTRQNEVTETIIHEDGSKEESTVTIEKPTITTQTNTEQTTQNPDGTTTTENALSIKGWSELESQAKSSINYTVTSLLSTQDDDTLYENKAKITSISLDKLTTLRSNFEWGNDKTTLTITPTTGSDRSNTYWIAGTIALVVVAGGFILLKKKVLK